MNLFGGVCDKAHGQKIAFWVYGFALFVSFISPSHAQAPPPGRGPCGAGAPVNGSCGSPSNAGTAGVTVPTEIWRDRFGAIAKDGAGNGVYTEGQVSRRVARRKVMKECGKGCEVIAETRNACLGLVNGASILYSGGANDAGSTRKLLVDRCTASKRERCEVIYVGCSYPVRVR